jgi:hypothetical protein
VDETRKFRVSGIDDLRDIHIFLTDDKERAEGVAEAMREELGSVDVLELPNDPGPAEPG